MAKDLCILGIDPGTHITGWGVISKSGNAYSCIDYGALYLSKYKELPDKLLKLSDTLNHLLTQHAIDGVAVETQYVAKNPQSALKLGMARGVVLLTAAHHKVPVFEYAPSKIKIASTGRGHATKEQVQHMVRHLLNIKEIPKPEDAADALAIALTHGQTIRSCYV